MHARGSRCANFAQRNSQMRNRPHLGVIRVLSRGQDLQILRSTMRSLRPRSTPWPRAHESPGLSGRRQTGERPGPPFAKVAVLHTEQVFGNVWVPLTILINACEPIVAQPPAFRYLDGSDRRRPPVHGISCLPTSHSPVWRAGLLPRRTAATKELK
jgi:hypothetical protein